MINARAMQRAMACLLFCFTVGPMPAVIAAPPALPSDVFGREVIGVLWVDAVQLDAAKLDASVKTAFGKHAAMINEWLGQYHRAHTAFVRAGGTSMAVLYYDGSLGRDSANPVFLFSKSQNANEATIKGVIRGISNDVAFDTIGGWIVAYDKNQALPFFDRGSALRVQSFQSALRPIQTHPIVAAFVSNRRQLASNARDEGEIKATHDNVTNALKGQIRTASTEEQRRQLNQRLASHTLTHNAVKALNDIERIMHQASSFSMSFTLGDNPVIEAELMLRDGAEVAEYMKLKPIAVEAFDKLMQKESMRGVPVHMVNRLAAQYAALSNAEIRPNGPAVRGRISGTSLAKMITGIVVGVNRSLDEAQIVRSMNQMKVIAIGLNSYARDKGGDFPAKLTELNDFQYLRNLDELLKNPRGEGYGYVYIKPAATLPELFKNNKHTTTPLLMETRNGRIDPNGLVVYVSGKVTRPEK